MPAARQSGQRLVMCAPCWLQPGPAQLRVGIVVVMVVVMVGRCGLYARVSVCGGSGACRSTCRGGMRNPFCLARCHRCSSF